MMPAIIPVEKCVHCGSLNLNKAGFTHNRKQRYYCRDCRRFSREQPVARVNKSQNNPAPRTVYKVSASGPLPSASHLILKIKALAQRLGRTPTTTDVMELAKQ